VLVISNTQRIDIAFSKIGDRGQISASPCEAFAIELDRQKVGGHSGEASVSVRKRMDEHEPMVKAHCDFVGRVGFVFDPGGPEP
jgi:hypothetical protein